MTHSFSFAIGGSSLVIRFSPPENNGALTRSEFGLMSFILYICLSRINVLENLQ